jgi:hypothetical protein
VWLFIAAGAAVATLARADDPGLAFTVGILRRDAIVVPFASYDGRKWRAEWPVPRDNYDVPVDLRSVPKNWWGPAGPRDTWQAWIGDEPPRPLAVVQPDWFPTYCLRAVGLRTDYHAREPLPPVSARPFPTDGLVVSPPEPIERIRVVDAADPLRAALAPVIHDTFNRTERTFGAHPIRRAVREPIVPAIEAVYAGPGARIVFVEAAREYHEHNDPAAECRAVAFGGGWFVRGADARYAPLQTYVTVLNCDRDGASYMLPLGIVRQGNQAFWLAQFSGWDGVHYEVDEIKSKTVEPVVSRFGGGC